MVVRGHASFRPGRSMRRSGGAGALAVLFLFILTVALPTGSAQAPPLPSPDDAREYLAIDLTVPAGEGYKKVQPGQQGRFTVAVTDASADNTQPANTDNPFPHTTQIRVRFINPEKPAQWGVTVSSPTLFTQPGQTVTTDVVVSPLYGAEINYVTILVNATLTGPDGQETYDEITLMAQLEPYYSALATLLTPPAKAGQFEIVNYELEIINQATYPDWYGVHVNATDGFTVRYPTKVYIEPLSSRIVNISIQTPHGKLFELGQNGLLEITVRSQSDPGFTYVTSGTIFVSGGYLDPYQLPLLAFGLMALGLVTQKSLQKGREAHSRKGKPRRVRVSPRQEVLLSELKRRDKGAYKKKVSQLNAVYTGRRRKYRSERSAERAAERAQRREQRREAAVLRKERKKERKLARKEERRLEKERRKERKAQAKVDRKQAKIDKKAAKKQAKLDEKAAKKQAKVDKKESKVRAKQEKKLTRELKRKERALKKAKAKKSGSSGGLRALRRKKD